ncbi:MAG: leucine-rich repeat domain-containing protein [Prevotella sp.]|nr:leucine-rich repeat domain-containing protein [Prevotella sp.]
MKKLQLFTIALLLTVATGAWATDWYKIQVTVSDKTFTQYSTLPYSKKVGECYQTVTGYNPPEGITVTNVTKENGTNVTIGTLSNWDTSITITAGGSATVNATLSATGEDIAGIVIFEIAVTQISSWESGDCTVMLDGGKLIVKKTDPSSATGAMADYQTNNIPWNDYIGDITKIVIDDGVTRIGNLAFASCNNASLTSVTIPASVTSIGEYAFDECSKLATVTFADGSQLTTIGDAAFNRCAALTSVTIPASVTSIGEGAFLDCTNLATVTLKSNPHIDGGAFLDIKDGATVKMELTAHEGATGEYWMTFYNFGYNFEADANTQIFKALFDGSRLFLTELTTDKIVKYSKPVIMKSTSATITMTLVSDEGSNNFSSNYLSGVKDPAGKDADGYTYVLNKGANGVGFYKLADGKTLGVGKVYLYTGGVESNFFGFDDETTELNEVKCKMSEVRGDIFFDLSGRRVTNPKKGIFIHNGKKFFNR